MEARNVTCAAEWPGNGERRRPPPPALSFSVGVLLAHRFLCLKCSKPSNYVQMRSGVPAITSQAENCDTYEYYGRSTVVRGRTWSISREKPGVRPPAPRNSPHLGGHEQHAKHEKAHRSARPDDWPSAKPNQRRRACLRCCSLWPVVSCVTQWAIPRALRHVWSPMRKRPSPLDRSRIRRTLASTAVLFAFCGPLSANPRTLHGQVMHPRHPPRWTPRTPLSLAQGSMYKLHLPIRNHGYSSLNPPRVTWNHILVLI